MCDRYGGLKGGAVTSVVVRKKTASDIAVSRISSDSAEKEVQYSDIHHHTFGTHPLPDISNILVRFVFFKKALFTYISPSHFITNTHTEPSDIRMFDIESII